jgi:hypothetical protein
MTTMIIEDVAVVVVIALFVWLVPVRRKGIPGLRGRGRVPSQQVPASRNPADEVMSRSGSGRLQRVPPRPVPGAEVISLADSSHPRWVPIGSQSHKNSA